jgi:DNA-directed RNA polymerase specialized sigma subunit
MNEDVVAYLDRLRDMHAECRKAHWDVDEAVDALMPRGVSYDGVKVQTSPEDRIAERVAELEAAQNRLKRATARYKAVRGRIIHQINKMPEKASTLLYLRYVHFRTFVQIADRMDYSYDYVRHLHRDALEKFGEMFAEDIDAWKNRRQK